MENETAGAGTGNGTAPVEGVAAATGTPPVPPGPAGPAPQDIALGLWDRALLFAEGLSRDSVKWQVAIVIALFIVAHFGAKVLAPRWEAWLRTREGWPTWRMRLGILIHRRMRLILYVAMIWPAYLDHARDPQLARPLLPAGPSPENCRSPGC